MRLLPLAVLGVALLSGCRETAPPPPPRVLGADELRPLYRELPRQALPELSSSALGQTYRLGGTVQDWQASRDVAISKFLPAGPAVTVGTLTSTGTVQMTAPLNLNQTTTVKLRDLMGGGGTLCPVAELNFGSNPDVQIVDTTLLIRTADLGARVKASALHPQTSPVPQWASLHPSVFMARTSASGPSTAGLLIYSPGEITVSGESRCIDGLEQTQPPGWTSVGQRHVRASVTLEAGWNAVMLTEQALRPDANGVGVQETLWTALPAEALATWTVNR